MHCPRCGTIATIGQQFCRSCGLNLEKVEELLGKELAVEPSSPNKDLARLRERQRKFEHWSVIAGFITFGLILVTLVVLGILNMIMSGSVSLAELFLILIAIGAATMGLFRTYSKSLKEKLANPP